MGTPQPSASGVNAARAAAIAAAVMATSVVEVVLWRGHEKHVTGLDWTCGLDTVQVTHGRRGSELGFRVQGRGCLEGA